MSVMHLESHGNAGPFACMRCTGWRVCVLMCCGFCVGGRADFSTLSPRTRLQHRDPGPNSHLRQSLDHSQITFVGKCTAHNYI